MSVELAASALSRALGLTDRQIKLLLRTGWIIAVTTWMTWCVGGLSFAGLMGPVSATEFNAVKADVTGIKLQLLEQNLFDIRLRQCKAETSESRQFYYERLQEKMNAYFEITGRNWHAPDCKEIQ